MATRQIGIRNGGEWAAMSADLEALKETLNPLPTQVVRAPRSRACDRGSCNAESAACALFSLRCWVRVRRRGFPLRFDGFASKDARAGTRTSSRRQQAVLAPFVGRFGRKGVLEAVDRPRKRRALRSGG
jgi:hypothetical protein